MLKQWSDNILLRSKEDYKRKNCKRKLKRSNIMTNLELMRKKGYSKKQIRDFYKKKERLAKMNCRYTLKEWERGE